MKLSNLIRKCIFISILFLPIIIQASEVEEEYSLSYALFMEAFMTMHVVFFVINPISKKFPKEKRKEVFWTLFVIRIIVLLIFDFFITTEIAAYDFYITALGAFIVSIYVETDLIVQKVPEATNQEVKNIELKCTRCGSILEISNKICPICNETLKDTIEPIPSGQNENSVHTPLDEKK